MVGEVFRSVFKSVIMKFSMANTKDFKSSSCVWRSTYLFSMELRKRVKVESLMFSTYPRVRARATRRSKAGSTLTLKAIMNDTEKAKRLSTYSLWMTPPSTPIDIGDFSEPTIQYVEHQKAKFRNPLHRTEVHWIIFQGV